MGTVGWGVFVNTPQGEAVLAEVPSTPLGLVLLSRVLALPGSHSSQC